MKDNQASFQRKFFIAVVFLFAISAIVADSQKTTHTLYFPEQTDGDIVYGIYLSDDGASIDFASEEDRIRVEQQELLRRAINLYDGVTCTEVTVNSDAMTIHIQLSLRGDLDSEEMTGRIKTYAHKFTEYKYDEANIFVVTDKTSNV